MHLFYLSAISIPATGETLSHPSWRQVMIDKMHTVHVGGTRKLVPL